MPKKGLLHLNLGWLFSFRQSKKYILEKSTLSNQLSLKLILENLNDTINI